MITLNQTTLNSPDKNKQLNNIINSGFSLDSAVYKETQQRIVESDSQRFAVPKSGQYNFKNIPLNDPRVWSLFARGDTLGIFQLEKQLGQDWSKKAKPQSIEELAALVSILRPGPLESGYSESYVKRKHGEEEITYLHPALEHILQDTYGSLIYQEQAMKIAVDLAGFSSVQADNLRKAIGKKKPEEMVKVKKMFLEGAKKKGLINEKEAEEIFGWIEKSVRYCVSGDTIIKKCTKGKYLKDNGYTVEHMFKIRNDIEYAKKTGHLSLYKKWKLLKNYGKGLSLDSDGRIRPNDIIDIKYIGKRQVLEIILENGAKIKVTPDHKFPIDITKEIKACDLKIGDYLLICGEYEVTDFKPMTRFSNKSIENINRNKSYFGQGFPKGEQNPFWTGGGFSKFEKAKEILENVCFHCGKNSLETRIETHHVDGNRCNNELENLIKLCSSCHKKIEYSNGRVKRGEKGYPYVKVKISSIKKLPEENVYDVIMNVPSHNFVTGDGIITSNCFNKAHAVSYALISYLSAYQKVHFPTEFYTSWLTYSDWKPDPKEEIYNLVQNARLNNVTVNPPDVRRKNIDFEIVGDKQIIFGLSHIRGVGSKAIDNIKELSDKDLSTFLGFLKSAKKIRRNVAESLIKSGACDCYGKSRTLMLRHLHVLLGRGEKDTFEIPPEVKPLTPKEYEYVMSKIDEKGIQNALYSLIEDGKCVKKRIPTIEAKISYLVNLQADTNRQKSIWEKLYLGLNLTCSAADDVQYTERNVKTCREVYKAENRSKVTMHCVIDAIRMRKTGEKSRNPGLDYCYLSISDNTGALINVVCWPEVYEKIKGDLIEDTVASIVAKKECWNGRDQIVVQDIQIIG
jgi:hypothetical protein